MTTVKTNEGHMDLTYVPQSAQDVVTLGYALEELFGTQFTQVNIESTSMPEAIVNTLYSFTPEFSGQPAPVWTLNIVPATINANVNPNTGQTTFSVPAAAGIFMFTYTANNGALDDTAVLTLSVVSVAVDASITSTTFPDMFVGQQPEGFYMPLDVTGTGPFTFALSAGLALPAGLTLRTDAIADPSEGIAFGAPTTATSGSSLTVLVYGATGVTASATIANGVRVYQFPGFTTLTMPSVSSGTNLSAAYDILFTGDPTPSLSVTGACVGHSWSKDGTAAGSASFSLVGTYILSANISNVCGTFGTQSANIALTMEVSLAYPPSTTYAWVPEFGKVLSGTSCSGWNSIVGSLLLDTQGYSAAAASTAQPLTWDASAGSLLNSSAVGSQKRLGHDTFAFAPPYRFGLVLKPPTDINDGSVHYIMTIPSTVPALQYLDNGATVKCMRAVLSTGFAFQSNNNMSRGAFNIIQFGASDATNGFVRVNAVEVSASLTAAASWSKFLLFHFGADKGFEVKRMIMTSATVGDAAHIDFWLNNAAGVQASGSNVGQGSVTITYPASGATPAGGMFYVKCSVNTTTPPTTVDIYDNGVLRYQYPGSAGAAYNHYLHHSRTGSRILQAVARTTQGDITSGAVTVSVAAQTTGSMTCALFYQSLQTVSGSVTGRRRSSIATGAFNNILSTSVISGLSYTIEVPDYVLADNSYTMHELLVNIDYAWTAYGKYTLIDFWNVNHFSGSNSVPAYISAGSTAVYGPAYSGNTVLAGRAGASVRNVYGGSVPRFWFKDSAGVANNLNEWKQFIDYLATQLMPGGVRRPGFFGFVIDESSWPLVANNSVDAALVNAWGGNVGYGAGGQKLFMDMNNYIVSKFPGVPVFPAWNYQGGGTDVVLTATMANARSAGYLWAGIRNWYRPKVAPYNNTGQASITIAQQYGAFWPATEANVMACIEHYDGGPWTTSGANAGNRATLAWRDWATHAAASLGIRVVHWSLIDAGQYPGPSTAKNSQEWSAAEAEFFPRLRMPDFRSTGPG